MEKFINDILRELMFKRIKRKCEEYYKFEIEEEGIKFTISLNFEVFMPNKNEISHFMEDSLKKEVIDIYTILELIRIMYNVGYFTEGVDGIKVNIFFY